MFSCAKAYMPKMVLAEHVDCSSMSRNIKKHFIIIRQKVSKGVSKTSIYIAHHQHENPSPNDK